MKQYPSGAKYFPIGYLDSENKIVPLNILSPDNTFTWGIKKNDFIESKEKEDWNVDVPLIETAPEEFKNLFEALDEKIKTFAFENSSSFFGKEKAKVVVDEFFSPTLKGVKDPRNGGAINKYKVSFKIPIYKGEYKILLCDSNKRPIFPTATKGETPDMFVPSKTSMRFIFNISSIWISNQRYGYSKKFQQGIIYEQERSILSGCIIKDSDDEAEGLAEEEEEEDDDDFGVRMGDVVADDSYTNPAAAASFR